MEKSFSPSFAGPLGNNSIIFDCMYYDWAGYSSAIGSAWSGSVSYSFVSGNTFNVAETTSTSGSYPAYSIDNQTRITTGGQFGAGTSTPYWIFTNASIADTIPIAIGGSGDVDFTVTAIEVISYNAKQYECFVLNDSVSGSWALYDVLTGVLIENDFQFSVDGTSYYYTMNLAATNANISPINIVSPENTTYYNSQVPVIAKNWTIFSNAWFRDSVNGGSTWSQNYTLVFNGTYFSNASYVNWANGAHLVQIVFNNTLGAQSSYEVSFLINSVGPGIEIMAPINETYSGDTPMTQLEVSVENSTYAAAAWCSYSLAGGQWTQNYTLTWNGSEFVTTLAFPCNLIDLQVFANNSQNQVASRQVWFTCLRCNSSAPSNGMYYNWNGFFSGVGDWDGNVSYTFVSGNIYDVTESNSIIYPSGGSFPTYSIDSQTRVATGGFFVNAGTGTGYTPLWIFINVTVGSYVPINIASIGDVLFQVTTIQVIRYQTVNYMCFILNNSNSWAYYDVMTGVLIEECFQMGSDLNYSIDMASTNIPFSLLNILSPCNQTYHYAQVPITVQSAYSFTYVWYHDSINGGMTWSQNISLGFNGTDFSNASTFSWESGFHVVQIFANTTAGVIFEVNLEFRINLFPPALANSTASLVSGTSSAYTFTVIYSDQDNDPPAFVSVNVNGNPYSMQQIDSGDSNYAGGCEFSCVVQLSPGNNSYFFTGSDGDFISNSGNYTVFVSPASSNTNTGGGNNNSGNNPTRGNNNLGASSLWWVWVIVGIIAASAIFGIAFIYHKKQANIFGVSRKVLLRGIPKVSPPYLAKKEKRQINFPNAVITRATPVPVKSDDFPKIRLENPSQVEGSKARNDQTRTAREQGQTKIEMGKPFSSNRSQAAEIVKQESKIKGPKLVKEKSLPYEPDSRKVSPVSNKEVRMSRPRLKRKRNTKKSKKTKGFWSHIPE